MEQCRLPPMGLSTITKNNKIAILYLRLLRLLVLCLKYL